LDLGTRLTECPAPDNLVWQDDHLLFSSGKAVLLLDGLHDHSREAEEILRFDRPVTAMAAAKDGSLAVGLGAEGIAIVGGEHDGTLVGGIPGARGHATTALCFGDPHTLFACLDRTPDLTTGARGSLWRIDLRGAEPLCLAEELAAPAGLLLRDLDTLVVSESARGRLLECGTARPRAPRVLLDELPGRPARLAWGSGGNVWLAIPVLDRREVGVSAGLVVHIRPDFTVEASLHGSREGRSRGAVSCLEMRGELIVACRDGDALIAVDLGHPSEI
jgi:hypothetical protein